MILTKTVAINEKTFDKVNLSSFLVKVASLEQRLDTQTNLYIDFLLKERLSMQESNTVLQERVKFLEKKLTPMPKLHLLTNEDGEITSMNKTALQFYELKERDGEEIGPKINLCSPFLTQSERDVWFQELKQGERKTFRTVITTMAGEDFAVWRSVKKRKGEKGYSVRDKELGGSMRDSLTGLYNKDYYIEGLPQVIREYHQHHESFALIFCDLNKFKPINDTYGHDIGDKVLKTVSRRLIKCMHRAEDIVIRMGGDEFLVVVRLANPKDIDIVMQNIRKVVQKPMREPVRDNEYITPSISLGAEVYDPDKGEKKMLDDMCRKADKKMYKDKARIKNEEAAREEKILVETT